MEVLLAGNTGYVTETFIEESFPECDVVVLGNEMLKSNRKKNILSCPFIKDEKELKKIFETYEFERIIYFSNYLTMHGRMAGELEQLRQILQLCKKNKEIRMLYLTGQESIYNITSGKTLLVSAAENVVMEYGNMYQINTKILRIPHLYSALYTQDFFYKLFTEAEQSGKIVFEESPEQNIYFLCMDDLAELLYKVYDNWGKECCLNVPDCFGQNFSDLEKEIRKTIPGKLDIRYQNSGQIYKVQPDDQIIRQEYGWFPKISVFEDIPGMYQEYKKLSDQDSGHFANIRNWISKNTLLVHILELISGFILFEFLNKYTGTYAQFKMIDLRLVFIVFMGSLYGINYGISAAALETCSLIAAYRQENVNIYTLFYEASNWIPFIFYFAAGAVCGYIRLKNKEDIEFVTKENRLIKEKFFFMQEMYQETLHDKRQYKKQILGSRDSFGKIFDITRKLDVIQPQKLFMETIRVMEDVLENHTIVLYSLDSWKRFGRMEVSSPEIRRKIPNSIRIEEYQNAIETLEKGEVWRNRELLAGYPAYIAGIRRNGELVMLVFIQDAASNQMTLYYLNLIKILCGLVEVSLLRALEYQEAVRDREYLEGTHILKTEYFMERLKLFHSIKEQKIGSYALLQIENPAITLEETDRILRNKIRENDILGISEDGQLYLILSQVDDGMLPIVIERIEKNGLHCRVIDTRNESRVAEE